MATLALNAEMLSPRIHEWFDENGFSYDAECPLAGKAGSSRTYYRILGDVQSWIVMQAHEVDDDFERFIFITNLFAKKGIEVPKIFVVDREYSQMLIEDLGTTTLYELLQFEKNFELYYQVIDSLIKIQKRVVVPVDQLSEPKIFDIAMLRWETGYFCDNYLKKYLDVTEQQQLLLDHEFMVLAAQVNDHKKVMMHRDFQSQNIMVVHGKLFIIDHQGARLGSYCYDLASLLWDPYVEMDTADVWKLVEYFYDNSYLDIPFENFKKEFIEASLQRLMQACGAYCFLSDTKGKTEFKQHLKPGLRVLKTVLAEYDGLAMLKKILGVV